MPCLVTLSNCRDYSQAGVFTITVTATMHAVLRAPRAPAFSAAAALGLAGALLGKPGSLGPGLPVHYSRCSSAQSPLCWLWTVAMVTGGGLQMLTKPRTGPMGFRMRSPGPWSPRLSRKRATSNGRRESAPNRDPSVLLRHEKGLGQGYGVERVKCSWLCLVLSHFQLSRVPTLRQFLGYIKLF